MSWAFRAFQSAFGGYSRVFPGGAAKTAMSLMMSPRISNSKRNELMNDFDSVHSLGESGFLSVRGDGPVKVLVVHGWSGWLGQFSELINRLDTQRYTVYGLHPPGHGLCDASRSHPGRFIEAIVAAREFAGRDFDIAVGHSMGAGTLAYVAAHERCFGKIVLIAGPSTIRGVLRRFSEFLNLGTRCRAKFFSKVENEVGLSTEAMDLRIVGAAIRAPALIIHDEKDREIPFSEAVELNDAIVNSVVFQTRNLGHKRILKAPMVIDRIMDFIKPSDVEAPAEKISLVRR